jgi:hypothetical protein
MAWRPEAGDLSLKFFVEGDLADIVWPEPGPQERADELWRYTCLEAFVAAQHEAGYLEFNFAASQRWAAYSFDGYRAGMTPVAVALEHSPRAMKSPLVATLEADLANLPGVAPDARWRLALTAVIEHVSGERSYWSARHPPGKPDFHHPDSFALELAPP